jgi:hypothetical protein
MTQAPQAAPPSAPPSPQLEEPQWPELQTGEPDGQWVRDFHGLLYIGALTGHFEWLQHRIQLRTLTVGEELIVSQLTHEWESMIGAAKAYSTAVCALAVQAIDGQPMITPMGEDPADRLQWARQRFSYAQRWFDPTITVIYNEYLLLETRVREVLDRLGKASPGTGPGSNGTPASLSGAEFSAAPGSP